MVTRTRSAISMVGSRDEAASDYYEQGSAIAEKSRATRCITANVLQTNKVDAECDKLATELS